MYFRALGGLGEMDPAPNQHSSYLATFRSLDHAEVPQASLFDRNLVVCISFLSKDILVWQYDLIMIWKGIGFEGKMISLLCGIKPFLKGK